MAFNDTLFQLGMDLTRSSPAQEEDLQAPAHDASGAVRDTAISDRESGRFAGRHLIVDLYGARKLDDIAHVERTLKRCVEAAGATLLHMHLHHLNPTGGVTGVAVLAESHISIHSWPDEGYAALDVFMSGDADPARAIPVLQEAFEASKVVVETHHRGESLGENGGLVNGPEKTTRAKKAAKQPAPIRLRTTRKTKVAA